ncbi:hypothetical protein GGR55DRAFT_702810 [Xylaria sp. FL0064]|nr:hypothetical protein GGR55DRAFT_702810 [Xylaria sp. FL0064]
MAHELPANYHKLVPILARNYLDGMGGRRIDVDEVANRIKRYRIESTSSGSRELKKRKRTTEAPDNTVSREPVNTNIIAELRKRDVIVYTPGQLEYERAVASSNLVYRFARPICVVQPASASNVQKIVIQARASNVSLTIENGGHSYIGSSTANKGVLLDMARMNDVKLDMKTEMVRVEGDVYKALINARLDGWAVNGSRCPSDGVSDFMLGGGIGPFSRGFGMGCDTVTEISIVTADGELITVGDGDDPASDKGMLFWALRGGGGGNFGMVVAMSFQVLPLSGDDGIVTAGRFTWFQDPKDEDYRSFLYSMNRFYTTKWSNEMTIDSSWFSDTHVQDGAIGVRFLVYYDGNERSFGKEIHNASLGKELEKQLKRRVLSEKSTRFFHETLAAQWEEEMVGTSPYNGMFCICSSFCFSNNRDDLPAITSIVKEELEAFRRLFRGEKSCLCQVTFMHSGGEAKRTKRKATAFRWRDTVYHTYIEIHFKDKWLERDMRGFLGKLRDRLKPLSLARQACFVSCPDASLGDDAYEKAYYGGNYLKLRQVKRIYDRTDFFNSPQGIKVASSGSRKSRIEAQVALEAQDENLSFGESVDYEEMTDKVASERWRPG